MPRPPNLPLSRGFWIALATRRPQGYCSVFAPKERKWGGGGRHIPGPSGPTRTAWARPEPQRPLGRTAQTLAYCHDTRPGPPACPHVRQPPKIRQTVKVRICGEGLENHPQSPASSSAAGHRGSSASAMSTRGGAARPDGRQVFSLHFSSPRVWRE